MPLDLPVPAPGHLLAGALLALAPAALAAAGSTDPHDLVRTTVLSGDYSQLPAQDATVGPQFGFSVAADGDWLAVGAPGTVVGTGAGEVRGMVFLFQRNGTQWTYRQRLPGFSTWGAAPRCGHSVSLKLPRLAIGCPGADFPHAPGDEVGAYMTSQLFDDTWSGPTGYRQSESQGQCGQSIALAPTVSGHPMRLAVGCPGTEAGRGSVIIFSGLATGTSWAPLQTLVAPDASPGDRYGESVALRRLIAFDLVFQTLAVGAPERHLGAVADTGAVYIYEGAAFLPTATLTLPNAILFPQARFGTSVAVNASQVLVGAPGGPGGGSICASPPRCGSIHRFAGTGGAWTHQDGGEAVNAGGNPPGGQPGMAFGASVALGPSNWIAAAAPLADGSSATLPPAVAADVGMVELRRGAGGEFAAGTGDYRGELRPSALLLGGSSQGRFGTGLAFGSDFLAVGYPRAGNLIGGRRGQVWIHQSDRLFTDGFEL